MIVQCDACNTKFRLDDSKVTAKGVRVRCTKCQNVFVVMPPPPSEEKAPPRQEETVEVSFGMPPEPSKKEAEVDFSRSPEQPAPPRQEEKKTEPSPWGMEFTFEEKPKEEEKKPAWDIGLPPEKEEAPFSFEEKKEAPQPKEAGKEIDFSAPHWGGKEAAPSFEAEKKTAAPEPSGFSFEEGFAPSEKTSFEIETPPTEEEFVVHPKEEAKTLVMEAPSIKAPSPSAPAESLLEKGVEKPKEVSFEAPSGRRAPTRIVVAAAVVLVLAIGAGVLYLNIGTGFLTKPAAQQKTLDLIGLKGYYINNVSLGPLFVIEGKVISNLNAPKEVAGIHGMIFDKTGKLVKDAWVAPGRIAAQDELKNISSSELEKRFKDKKGAIPPKGTVPFMIVFQGIPGELAEFSVEIGQ
ncbi:MAG: zinc-ribbon domain-containing protein [Deltaproteobacteria bacterium]|nr:zinc-ribbon domain-containing protein [Deltaproteobacteria bacterium]